MTLRLLATRGALLIVVALSFTQPVSAQLAVSSNDNKAELRGGINTVVANPPPDTVTVIDLGVSPPRVVGEVEAPGGWSAPPQSVAVAPDESIALVVSSTRLDPADPTRTIFSDEVTVLDLESSPPQVLTTLRAGARASGVSINRAGTLALVANRAAGSVSVFAITGKVVTPVGTVDLCENCQPSLPVFTPDGRRALVTRNGDHLVSILEVNGQRVTYAGVDISANLSPYSLDITPDGRVAVVANIGNGPTGGVDTVGVIDLETTPPRLVDAVTVGVIPEGLALSPDGKLVAVTVMNGSNLPPDSPSFNDFGLLKIYRLVGTTLSAVTETRVGHWCQGVVWSNDATTLLVQCSVERELMVFQFDGTNLLEVGTIPVSGGPTGIRTAQVAP